MGKIIIIANNFFEKASGSIRDDANYIITQSAKKVIQNGEKGVNYNKNRDRKPLTDIRITKIEGPFDTNGELVEKVILGKSYIFKATPTRKPTITEITLLKWSVKLDEGQKEIILGTASVNKLIADKIIIYLKINQDFKNAKVFAFYQKADGNVSVAIKINIFQPYTIAKSRHRKGMDEEGKEIHHDMMSKDMSDKEIIALNPDTKKWIDIVNNEGYEGLVKLAAEMEDLLTDFSQGELEEVNLKMCRKFFSNKTGDFSDKYLTKAAEKHESTTLFFERIRKNMQAQLKIDNNFVFEQQLLINREIIDKKKIVQRKDTPSPSYSDKYGGLGIAVNDTWGYDMKIITFEQNIQKRTFSAEFELEIFDHYGLNSEDIDPKIKGGWFGPASFEGFLCWFILQHKCGYKPFLTIIKMRNKITNETY